MLAVGMLVVAIAYRLWVALVLPVGYDEVFVMGVGLDRMTESLGSLTFGVPVEHSSGVTPLWWWLQYSAMVLAGGLSLVALRIGPAVLGVVALLAAYRLSMKTFGRRTALIFLAFVSLSDILSFTNGRGEFAESLTVVCIISGVCLVGRPKQGPARGAIWFVLLMTSLSKGMFVVALMVMAELAVLARTAGGRCSHVRDILLGLALAVVPTLFYLLAAQHYFAPTGVIHHEAVEASSVFELTGKLTFDYTQVKAHVTGSVRDSALVWLDFAVWPTTAISTPLLLASVFSAVWRLGKSGFRPRSRREQAMLALLVWGVVGAVVVVGRGTLGARFHLMYLPAFWMLAALSLGRSRWQPAIGVVLVGGVIWAAYVGLAASWVDWRGCELSISTLVFVGGVLTTAVAGVLWWNQRRRPSLRARVVGTGVVVSAASLCIAGPTTWAYYSRFEPMSISIDKLTGVDELGLLDAYRSGRSGKPATHNRTLLIDLANYYLRLADDCVATDPAYQRNLEMALARARRETRRVPDDARAWAYVGEALFRLDAPVEQTRSAWRRSLQLAPNERISRRLEELAHFDGSTHKAADTQPVSP